MGPLTKALVEVCRENPGNTEDLIRYSKNGVPVFNYNCGTPLSFIDEPNLGPLVRQMQTKVALAVLALCKQNGVTPVFSILPSNASGIREAPFLSCHAFSSDWQIALAKDLRKAGVKVLELQTPFGIIAPQFFPQWNKADSHLLYRGQQTLAYVWAREFEKLIAAP